MFTNIFINALHCNLIIIHDANIKIIYNKIRILCKYK